jgi:DNA topoisomerase-3
METVIRTGAARNLGCLFGRKERIMSKFLVIAEKPSVAQSYAKNLSAYKREDGYLEGESCIVSWCLGHLAEYAQPEEYDPKYEKWQFDDLPILPETWKLKVSKDKKKQFEVIKTLMNRSDVEYLVNGCDAGREGELIFQRVYDLAGCRKPVKRLWISSMEDAAIQKGFQTMKSEEEYKNLCMAAVCRAQADWLIGMNGTRAYTTRYFKRLVVGRVQTPTLAMLAERQERIEHFQKEAFYKVALTDGKLTVVSENIANEEAADLLAALCNGSTAVVTQMKKERKKSFPPKLYDLTSLQREANRYFGYTAKRTLDMLQELYEEKLVTYPRTDSQFVTEDMKDSVEELVGKMPVLLPFVDYGQLGHGVKRVINNAKVSDHHAILPTKEAVEKGISDLPSDKKNLMMLICQQLVQATGEEYLYEQTDITVKCQEQDFKARGKIPVQMGFKEVEKAFKQLCVKAEPVEGKEKETSIPAGYEEGMRIFPVKAEKTTHYTSPPKPFNEDTLLAAMETAGNKEFDSETEKKGLGTPATRASIIEKLVSSGYAQRKGKQILPSTEGKELVKVMPEYLKSAVMTAEWENQLLMMEKGQITDTQFMGEITSLVRKILEVCREIPEEERRRFQTAREVIGKCPVCGCDVFEGKQNFYCSNRQCDFALWKENRFLGSMEKNLDKKMARELLDKACTHVKGLYSKKKDMKFDADLLLTLEDGKPRFHLEFPKKKKK